GLIVESNNQVSRRLRSACGWAPRSRRLPQKLAMREIAEIIPRVTSCSSRKIGTRDHRLRFQRLERGASQRFGLDHGSYRCFQIHRDDWHQHAIYYFDVKRAPVPSFHLAGHAKDKISRVLIAPGRVKLFCPNLLPGEAQEQDVSRSANLKPFGS